MRFPTARFLVVVGLLASIGLAPATVRAQAFAYELVADGFHSATDLAFAPDGRIFVAELDGTVRIVKNGALLPTPFIKVPVSSIGERGLLGLALDPAFASNGRVYLYHSVETNAADPEGPKSARLTRVTAQGDVALPSSEAILLGKVAGAPSCADVPVGSDCIPIDSVSHMGGSLAFGPDGTLFVGTGDGILTSVDPARSLRAQDLDVLAGKILRIQPTDGSAPSSNPYFTGNPSANRSKVWSYGVRQPFRMGMHPQLGIPLVGDVGDGIFEELSFAERGADLGWPCYEARLVSPYPVISSNAVCQALYTTPPANLRFPAYSYQHVGSTAVVAGVFASPSAYPASIAGRFVFGDYAHDEVRLLTFTGSTPSVTYGAAIAGPVAFATGTDGRIYVLSIVDGAIYRLVEIALNVPPIARIDATPVAGLTPLAVTFSSSASVDPNGDALLYSWDFGDGGTSSLPSPTHVYQQNGSFTATLTLRDPSGASDTASVRVLPGRQAPVVTITSPPNATIYQTGDPLAFRVTATDADDGVLTGSSLFWTIRLGHCVNAGGAFDCHAHPLAGGNGTAFDLAAPDHGTPSANEFFYVDAQVQATDSDGVSTKATVRVGPDIDADGCMDFYVPFATATAPFAGGSDKLSGAMPGSFVLTNQAWNPNGVFTNTAIAATPPNGSATVASFAALLGPFSVTEDADYAISFDASLTGIVGMQPGPVGADAELVGRGLVLQAGDDTTVGSSDLFSYRLQGSTTGPVVTTPISQPNALFPFVTRLEPGDYQWGFLTLGTALVTSGPANTNIAAASSTVTLHEARLCKQRLPDAALP